MSEVRVIQVNESIFAENDRSAELIRKRLTAAGKREDHDPRGAYQPPERQPEHR